MAMLLEMKLPCSFRGGAARGTRVGQILGAGLVCAAALLAAGCGRQAQSPTSSAPAPQDTSASQPAPATPTTVANSEPAPVATATNAAPDLRELNGEMLSWIMDHHRRPASFEDFAATANIKIPPPPPGKKYILNGRGLITLANVN